MGLHTFIGHYLSMALFEIYNLILKEALLPMNGNMKKPHPTL